MRDFANQKKLLKESAKVQHHRSISQEKRGSHSPVEAPRRYGRWVLLAIIIVIVAVIAARRIASHHQQVVPASQENKQAQTVQDAKGQSVSQGAAKQPAVTKPQVQKPSKPVFDFYTVLPQKKAQPEATQKEQASGQQAENVTQSNKQFMLQVASYQSEQLAQQLRSQLILLGLKPVIKSTGSGWYRIDVGPYDTMRAADQVRHQLQDSGINGAMVRQVNAHAGD